MDNFDLRKYLTEGRLMKETLDDEVWAMVEKMVEMMGAETVVDAIVRAMSTADAKLYLSAIMRDYDLNEGKINEEKMTPQEEYENLPPLQKYIYDYESNISDEIDIDGIRGLKNADDVYNYYAYDRGWADDEDLADDLDNIYNQVKVEFPKLAENKINEGQPTVFDDKNMDALLNIILKYVKDPDDAERELEKFEDRGYDALSPELLANLDRDPEFKAWYKDLHSINEGHGLSLQDVGILRYLLKMIKDDIKIQSPSGRKDAIRVLQFLIDSNIDVDKTRDLSKEK